MQTLHDIFYFGGAFFVFVMIIGIVRPHLVLFWTEDKDRSMVLKAFVPIVLVMLIGTFVTSSYLGDEDTFKDEDSNNINNQEEMLDQDSI